MVVATVVECLVDSWVDQKAVKAVEVAVEAVVVEKVDVKVV